MVASPTKVHAKILINLINCGLNFFSSLEVIFTQKNNKRQTNLYIINKKNIDIKFQYMNDNNDDDDGDLSPMADT